MLHNYIIAMATQIVTNVLKPLNWIVLTDEVYGM
jgi:hypothetical protein